MAAPAGTASRGGLLVGAGAVVLLLLHVLTHLEQPLWAPKYPGLALLLVSFTAGGGLLSHLFCSGKPRARGLLLLLVPVVLVAALMLAGLNPAQMPGRLANAALAGLIWLAALSAGLALLRALEAVVLRTADSSSSSDLPRRDATPAPTGAASDASVLERLVFAAGLGMLTLTTLTFVLGSFGAVGRLPAGILVALALLAGARDLPGLLRGLYGRTVERLGALPPLGGALLGFVLIVLALVLAAAYMPPLDYDVVEYHAQLPREYLEDGRVAYLPHNAFSAFPHTPSMATLLAMQLAGSATDGAREGGFGAIWIAQLVNLGHLFLLLVALAALVRRLVLHAGPSATERASGDDAEAARAAAADLGSLAACVLTLATWQTLALAMKLYVELALTAYLLLAALALVRALQVADGRLQASDFRLQVVLAGLLAGGAASTKYPGLLFVGLPVTLLLLMARGVPWKRRLLAAALAGGLCWLVVSPWLIRNAIATGNPVHPLLTDHIPTRGWTEAQTERFRRAHRSTDFSFGRFRADLWSMTIGGRMEIAGHEFSNPWLGGLALIFLPGLLFVPRGRGRPVLALLVWGGLGFLLWWLLTHRLERFFYPLFVLLTALSGAGLAFWLKKSASRPFAPKALTAAALAVSLTAVTALVGANALEPIPEPPGWGPPHPRPTAYVFLGCINPKELLPYPYSSTITGGLQFVLQDARGPRRALMVGAADPFWFPSDVEYAVVFSRHPFFELLRESASADEVLEKLRERGISHLYINWFELARLHATYYQAYDLTPPEQERLREVLDRLQNGVASHEIISYSNAPSPGSGLSMRELIAHDVNPYFTKLVRDWPAVFAGELPRCACQPYVICALPEMPGLLLSPRETRP